jgi:hypothetical protein
MTLMPSLAILNHELRGLANSWLVRLWFLATAVLTLLAVAGSWPTVESAPLIASLLFSYLVFPWFLVVIALGISPVTGTRLDALADGILSRPVTRHEYLLASWAARVLIVLAVFLAVNVPASLLIMFANRPVPDDGVTWYGILASLCVVSLVLTFLVTLSFFAAAALRMSMLAAVVLVFIWLPINLVLHTFSLEEFSPISLSQALPTLLRTPWREQEVEQDSQLSPEDIEALTRQANQFLAVLSGGSTPKTDSEGSFFEQGSYEDFSLLRVVLGYGLPTCLALGLTMLFFCWRDL